MADLRQENTAVQESMGHVINLKSLRLNQGFRPQAVPFFSSNGLFAWLMGDFRPSFLHKSDVKVSGSPSATSTTVRAASLHCHSFPPGPSACKNSGVSSARSRPFSSGEGDSDLQ